ncbi:hypothetical protein NLJ89_g11720 [Agrocybe chaxingu]|uniref:Uncharacterized protein n=1 Tax=Agrocybe chaxingu TaxID=84603 RepID=A0A9W8JNU4_9AGAR|nr:hypothetical protein NLJ89_g11720 [Agrocybe chaxingu]
MAYQAILFDNPAAPFGLVDPLYYPSIAAIYPTYSPPCQGSWHIPPTIPSIYPSHKATQRRPASGAQRTSKKIRSQTSGPYDRASSHRRQHITEHQRLSFPDERGKPFSRADRQPFATPAASHPGAQPGDLSAPPPGNPFGSWANQHGVSPPQSTLEEKTTNQILSSQWVESGASAALSPVHQNKQRGNPSTKPPQEAKAANRPAKRKPRRDDGFGRWGNPVPDELTFVQTDSHPQFRDRFMLFNGPTTTGAAETDGGKEKAKPIRVQWA